MLSINCLFFSSALVVQMQIYILHSTYIISGFPFKVTYKLQDWREIKGASIFLSRIQPTSIETFICSFASGMTTLFFLILIHVTANCSLIRFIWVLSILPNICENRQLSFFYWLPFKTKEYKTYEIYLKWRAKQTELQFRFL